MCVVHSVWDIHIFLYRIYLYIYISEHICICIHIVIYSHFIYNALAKLAAVIRLGI